MVIDEKKNYILTNYKEAKNGKACDSDHATQFVDLNIKTVHIKPERKEIFNFKEKGGQAAFKQSATESEDFTDCFEKNVSLLEQIENWRQVLKMHCSQSFKKIRIQNKKKPKPMNSMIVKLINERNALVNNPANMEAVETLNKKIANLEAEENRNEIFKHFKSISDNPESINLQQMWKNIRKLWPKCFILPKRTESTLG